MNNHSVSDLPLDPLRPDKHIDPRTGIWPIREWGGSCARGWVSDSMFGPSQRVIARTNRTVTKKWRQLEYKSMEARKLA